MIPGVSEFLLFEEYACHRYMIPNKFFSFREGLLYSIGLAVEARRRPYAFVDM
jgi:hypothetical protein